MGKAGRPSACNMSRRQEESSREQGQTVKSKRLEQAARQQVKGQQQEQQEHQMQQRCTRCVGGPLLREGRKAFCISSWAQVPVAQDTQACHTYAHATALCRHVGWRMQKRGSIRRPSFAGTKHLRCSHLQPQQGQSWSYEHR